MNEVDLTQGTEVPLLLVVDDEDDIRELIRTTMERDGFDVVEAAEGKECLRKLYEDRPAAVLLDVMMPGLDGWTVLDRIREVSDVPVILVTARGFDWERAGGLRRGADDYVVKPFSPMELAARVGAVLRRTRVASDKPLSPYEDGFLKIDFEQRRVVAAGNILSLTPLEYRLLTTFVRHRDQVLERDQLLELVWGGPSVVFPEQVKVYVGYLRRKLGNGTDGRSPIETVRGFGYMYRSVEAGTAHGEYAA